MSPVFKKWISSTMATGMLLATTVGLQAWSIDLLRDVPLEIGAYEASDHVLDTSLTSADAVMNVLQGSQNLLVHMEVLRRGYTELSTAEQQKLIKNLLARKKAMAEDTASFFDYGYAELVYNRNKTGLFFLRKANDRLKNQFTSLAYAMAQAEVDLNEEGASPSEMTTRKLDVTYKLTDAVHRDAKSHKPGFWASFVRVQQKLQPVTAFKDIVKSDFSTSYVPYATSSLFDEEQDEFSEEMTTVTEPLDPTACSALGKKPLALTATPVEVASAASPASSVPVPGAEPESADTDTMADVEPTESDDQAVTTDAAPESSEAAVPPVQHVIPENATLYKTLNMDLNNDKVMENLNFYQVPGQEHYTVVITNKDEIVLGVVEAPAATYLAEDLDGDHIKEIVIRQFHRDPYHPVHVYRLKDCQYQLDESVEQVFL
ncbi:MAG: hypothetical protein KTR14_02130 [Vampirovibrio sp.]|nr:hypothetical protein [Vampirovibrio sp.]